MVGVDTLSPTTGRCRAEAGRSALRSKPPPNVERSLGTFSNLLDRGTNEVCRRLPSGGTSRRLNLASHGGRDVAVTVGRLCLSLSPSRPWFGREPASRIPVG